MNEPKITYTDEEVLDANGKVIGFNIIKTTTEIEEFFPETEEDIKVFDEAIKELRYEVYSQDFKTDDWDLHGSFDSYELAVAEATRITEAEDRVTRVTCGVSVIWDNGDELDDEGVPLRINKLVKYMTAEGLLTEPDSEGRRGLTPKGEDFLDVEKAKATQRMLDDGVVVRDGNTIRLTEKGREEVEEFVEDNPGWVVVESVKVTDG